MAKILIADPSEEQCAAVARALGSRHSLQICHDGRTARQLLSAFRPDAVILELRLQFVDGLTLLEGLDQRTRPAILVYTGIRTEYVDLRLQNLSDYVLYKPGDLNMLSNRLEDIICVRQNRHTVTADTDPLQAILLELMQHPNRSGYRYLLTAIRLYAQDPKQAVTKELYPNVARQFDTNSRCVEKAIRDAIDQAWRERNNDVWRRYFPVDRNGQVCKPTNKAFFALLSQRLTPVNHMLP